MGPVFLISKIECSKMGNTDVKKMSRYVRVSMPSCVLKVPIDFNLDDLKGNMLSGFYVNGERVDHLEPGTDYDFTPLPVVPEWYVQTLAEEYFERHVVFDPSPPTWTGVVEHARQYVADMRLEQKEWLDRKSVV
jgi:hypothetical protein